MWSDLERPSNFLNDFDDAAPELLARATVCGRSYNCHPGEDGKVMWIQDGGKEGSVEKCRMDSLHSAAKALGCNQNVPAPRTCHNKSIPTLVSEHDSETIVSFSGRDPNGMPRALDGSLQCVDTMVSNATHTRVSKTTIGELEMHSFTHRLTAPESDAAPVKPTGSETWSKCTWDEKKEVGDPLCVTQGCTTRRPTVKLYDASEVTTFARDAVTGRISATIGDLTSVGVVKAERCGEDECGDETSIDIYADERANVVKLHPGRTPTATSYRMHFDQGTYVVDNLLHVYASEADTPGSCAKLLCARNVDSCPATHCVFDDAQSCVPK